MLLKWFFVKIWFYFKRITVGDDILGWVHTYFKTQPGSEREKIAFKKAVELWAIKDPKILKIYPDYSPPNILRKIAFNNMYVYLHDCIAVAFFESMDILRDRNLGDGAKETIVYYEEKYSLWENFFLSKPGSRDEEISLKN